MPSSAPGASWDTSSPHVHLGPVLAARSNSIGVVANGYALSHRSRRNGVICISQHSVRSPSVGYLAACSVLPPRGESDSRPGFEQTGDRAQPATTEVTETRTARPD